MTDKPLAIELFAGMFGWSRGWLEMGGRAVGVDIEHLPHHGDVPEGASLVIQDCLTLHGSQFAAADVIFASPPCQNYSYLAMPWSRSKSDGSPKAKALRRRWETEGPDNRLFDACFRIQREASEAAGRHIPMVVENVRGAIPWVGRSKGNYGSFHLWGDVETVNGKLQAGVLRFGANFNGADHETRGVKVPYRTKCQFCGYQFEEDCGKYGCPNCNGEGMKSAKCGTWFHDATDHALRVHSSRSPKRKAASARIAMIPPELSRWIARCYWPVEEREKL